VVLIDPTDRRFHPSLRPQTPKRDLSGGLFGGSQHDTRFPLEINGWKMIFLLGWPIFRCYKYDSFRECDQSIFLSFCDPKLAPEFWDMRIMSMAIFIWVVLIPKDPNQLLRKCSLASPRCSLCIINTNQSQNILQASGSQSLNFKDIIISNYIMRIVVYSVWYINILYM